MVTLHCISETPPIQQTVGVAAQRVGEDALRFRCQPLGKRPAGEGDRVTIVGHAGSPGHGTGALCCAHGIDDLDAGIGQQGGAPGTGPGMRLCPAKGVPVDEPGSPGAQRVKGSLVQRAARGLVLFVGAVKHGGLLLLLPSS